MAAKNSITKKFKKYKMFVVLFNFGEKKAHSTSASGIMTNNPQHQSAHTLIIIGKQ